jgi:hypothetical protein
MGETTELACRLMGKELTERKAVIAAEMLDHANSITELPAGYELRFAGTDEWIGRVFDFVRLERQCCPFIRFEVGLSPNDGPVTLRLLGNPEVKRFIASEILAAGERQPEITPKRYSAD